MANYDDKAALTILAAHGEKVDPHATDNERVAEAKHIVEVVLGLNGRFAGLRTEKDPRDGVWVKLGDKDVKVTDEGKGDLLVYQRGNGKKIKLSLTYNAVEKKLEGERGRDALVEVAEAVVKMLKS